MGGIYCHAWRDRSLYHCHVSRLAYTVIAETQSKASADTFSEWLTDGHIDDVIRAGAASATLVRIENEAPATYRFEVRYLFDSPEAFSDYEAGPASALRQEGVKLFGPESEHPMRFSRIIGTVVSEHARED